MQFGNEMQKNVYLMVKSWFAEAIKAGNVHEVDGHPAFMIQEGSAVVSIGVNPLGDDEASITVASNVVQGAKITGELLLFLLAYNRRSIFGAFGVDPESGTISCDHSIVGSTCDQKELIASISFVSKMADQYDDVIVEKFGGKTALQLAKGG